MVCCYLRLWASFLLSYFIGRLYISCFGFGSFDHPYYSQVLPELSQQLLSLGPRVLATFIITSNNLYCAQQRRVQYLYELLCRK